MSVSLLPDESCTYFAVDWTSGGVDCGGGGVWNTNFTYGREGGQPTGLLSHPVSSRHEPDAPSYAKS